MRVIGAPRRLGIDTAAYFTPYAGAAYRAGYRTIFRYIEHVREHHIVSCTDPKKWFKPLSAQELDELVVLNWNVGIVQRSIRDLHGGGAAKGTEIGDNAVYNAEHTGIPKGATIFCDCEWKSSVCPSKQDQIDYIEAWAYQVHSAGYIAGLYVSPEMKLSSKELWQLAKIKAYWKSASYVPAVDVRGYQVIQSLEYAFDTRTLEMYEWNGQYSPHVLRCDLNQVCADGIRGSRVQVICA
jgi:hypothetical protein